MNGIKSILGVAAAAATLVAPQRTVAAQDRAGGRAERAAVAGREARALLGIGAALSGTDRDTLGILVASVAADGPAELAGIAQGTRLSVVNGVSLRIDPEDVGRPESAEAVLRRFARALQAVEPGSEVTLRVYADEQFRLVRVLTPEPRRPEPPSDELAWAALGGDAPAAPRKAPARAPGGGGGGTAVPASVAGVLEGLATIQLQVHRLAQEQESGALLDTLTAIDEEIGLLRRRLRAATSPARPAAAAQEPAAVAPRAAATPVPSSPAAPSAPKPAVAAAAAPAPPAGAADAGAVLPGLRVSAVAAELAAYFGEGSEKGLLVLQADSSWAPIRTGDVLLFVNGAPADVTRLRAAAASRRQSAVEVLRRKRPLTLALPPRA